MARNATLRPVETNGEEATPAIRYTELSEALRDLKYEFRRILTQLDGDLKMANLEYAGPANKDQRRKAAVTLLKAAKGLGGKAFDNAIDGMA